MEEWEKENLDFSFFILVRYIICFQVKYTEGSHRRCSIKKTILKILQYSQEFSREHWGCGENHTKQSKIYSFPLINLHPPLPKVSFLFYQITIVM